MKTQKQLQESAIRKIHKVLSEGSDYSKKLDRWKIETGKLFDMLLLFYGNDVSRLKKAVPVFKRTIDDEFNKRIKQQ